MADLRTLIRMALELAALAGAGTVFLRAAISVFG